MERILMMTTAAIIALGAPLPTFAAFDDVASVVSDGGQTVFDRKGRGRGRGGHDDGRPGGHGNGNDDTGSGSGRDKPRIPGGSGCDDAGDAAEHAGCRG